MKVVSVNVGMPREIVWQDRPLTTSIFKSPVEGRVPVRRLNLDGDKQSDLTVHGGSDKAVYGYPADHYPAWKSELPDAELGWGAFGENLTIDGLLETDLAIGDVVRAGTAELMVTQPRVPCMKLAARFGRPDMVKRFADSRRSGFYFRVVTEGEVGAGDSVEFVDRVTDRVTVRDLDDLFFSKTEPDRAFLRRVLGARGLAEVWRVEIEKILSRAEATG